MEGTERARGRGRLRSGSVGDCHGRRGGLVIGGRKAKVGSSKEGDEHSPVGQLQGSDVLGKVKVDRGVVENSRSYFKGRGWNRKATNRQ